MKKNNVAVIADENEILESDEELEKLINEFWNVKTEFEVPDISPEIMSRIKKAVIVFLFAAAAFFLAAGIFYFVSYKKSEAKFNDAVSKFNSGHYAAAIREFSEFDEKNPFHEKSDVYIRKYKTAESLFTSALEFYKQNNFDEALNTLSTLDIVVHSYPQAEKLKKEVDAAKEQQMYLSEDLAKEGISLVEMGDIDGAYKKLERSATLADGEGNNLRALKRSLALNAAATVNNAYLLFQNGKVSEASDLVADLAKRIPDFSGITFLNAEISRYYSALELVNEAQNLFDENKFAEANAKFEEAASMSPVVLKTHHEILEKLKGNVLSRDLMTDEQKEFLDKLEITNVLYTENAQETGMILLFDMKNITDTPFSFRSYWCQAELNGEVYYPEPATSERYASAVRVNEGIAESEFAEDDLTIEPGETYRLMFNFSGERDFYNGAVFYYTDRSKTVIEDGTDGVIEDYLKIPLLVIESGVPTESKETQENE